ncbi:MAG: O-antigen ligase family protein [Candidatus Dormibacteraeota bacterium]|nr:O-antigen ligase family protein [Candidatus Dormibacteraeota bacterium]
MINQLRLVGRAERPAGFLLASVLLLLVAFVPAAVVLQVPPGIVAAFTALLALLILALRPDIATLVVIAMVYSNAAVVGAHFHNVPFAVAAGTPVLLLGVPLGYYLLIRRQTLVVPPAMPWILGYLLIQLASTMISRDSSAASAVVGIFLSEGLLLYLLIVNTVRSERMVLGVVCVLLAVGAVLGAVSLHQELTQNFSHDYLGFAQVGGTQNVLAGEVPPSRTAGPLGRANRYAQIMVLLLPLVFAIIWGRYSRRASVLAIGAGGFIAVAVALTQSRGAAVGFALVLVVMLILRYIKVRHIAVLVLAVFALFIIVPAYGTRLQSLNSVPGLASGVQAADGSIRSRITETVAAALVFVDHPLIGVGPGQFPTYYADYAQQFGLRVRTEDREAHNLYFGIASESGVLGSFFFFGAIVVTMRDLARTRSRLLRKRPRLAYLATGFLLVIVAYLTTGIFLHLSFERYLWLMLALGAAVSAIGMPDASPDAVDSLAMPDREEVDIEVSLGGPAARVRGNTASPREQAAPSN